MESVQEGAVRLGRSESTSTPHIHDEITIMGNTAAHRLKARTLDIQPKSPIGKVTNETGIIQDCTKMEPSCDSESLSPIEEDTDQVLINEVLAVVAELLIGDFAFTTTANLSMASHAVRFEILPVLYETICLERMDAVSYLNRMRHNPGLKYTKFAFHHESLKTLPGLPNLVMSIGVNCGGIETTTRTLDFAQNPPFVTPYNLSKLNDFIVAGPAVANLG